MSLLVDKYRPSSIKGLTFHPEITSTITDLAKSDDIPHLLMHGPPGAGKMTRIRILLQEIFDSSISKIKYEEKAFLTPSGKKIEIVLFSSVFHIEINPSDVGIYDRVVIQEIIKELAQTQQIDKSKKAFKVVVINDSERLSKDAQHALRRTMENSSIGRIIPPIKSRCLLIRIPAPSNSSIEETIQEICKSEGLKLLTEQIKEISNSSERNARKAILALESYAINQGNLVEDWREGVANVGRAILKEQSPNSLLSIRSQFYDLLTHCIPPSLIVKTLLVFMIKNVDSILSPEIATIFAEYVQLVLAIMNVYCIGLSVIARIKGNFPS